MLTQKDSLCDSCTNIGCIFQSGIVRKECVFYMPPHMEPDSCGNYLGVREFEEIVVNYPPEDLCTYPEYKGKPYFGIKYKENGEEIVGYGTYKPEVLSQYLKDYFISTTKETLNKEAKPRKGEWLRMSDLSEQEDDRYKCSRCGNVVHHKNKMDLYTFNSWCGRCGSDNRCFESQGEIPRHFSNCEVLVEKRKNGIQPSIYIKTADSVYIVGITPDCNFDITDESNNWDIIDGVPKFIKDVENEDYASLCTQRFCLKNHNIGIIECYEKYCPNRTKW